MIAAGYSIKIDNVRFNNISLLFGKYTNDKLEEKDLGKYFINNNTFNLDLNMTPLGYWMYVYFHTDQIHIDINENEIIGIMINILFYNKTKYYISNIY